MRQLMARGAQQQGKRKEMSHGHFGHILAANFQSKAKRARGGMWA